MGTNNRISTRGTWHSALSCRSSASLSSKVSLRTDRNTPSTCSSSWTWKLCPRSSLTSWSGRLRLRNRRELLRRGRELLRSRRDRGGWRSSGPGRNSSSNHSRRLLSSSHSSRDLTLTPGGDNPSSSLNSSNNANSSSSLNNSSNNVNSSNSLSSSSNARGSRPRTSFLWETKSLSSQSRN